MTDGQLFYITFVALYVLDGIARFPRESWLFVKPWWGRRWFLKRPTEVASRLGEGYFILPTMGHFLPTGEGWWFAESNSKRIRWVDSPEGSAVHAKVKDPTRLWRDRSRLMGPANTGTWIFTSMIHASNVLAWLRSILPGNKADIVPDIRARLADSLSLPRAKAALKKSRLLASQFRFTEWLLTLYIFFVLPFLFSYYQSSGLGFQLIAVIFPFTFMMSVTWWITIGRMFPQFKKGRWFKVLPVFFLPYHTLRMPQHLCMNLTSGVHPLAMGKILLDDEGFSKMAGDFMRKLRYPLGKTIPAAEWDVHFTTCARFLIDRCDLPESVWAGEIPDHDEVSESYCPRCHAQYLEGNAECDVCDGLTTVRFDPKRVSH